MSCVVRLEHRDRAPFTCWLNLKNILGYMCAAMKLNLFPPQDLQIDDNQNTVWKWWAVFPCLCHPELREHDWWVKCELTAELHYIIISQVQVKNHFRYQWEVAVFAYKNWLVGSFTAHHHFKFMFSSVTRDCLQRGTCTALVLFVVAHSWTSQVHRMGRHSPDALWLKVAVMFLSRERNKNRKFLFLSLLLFLLCSAVCLNEIVRACARAYRYVCC